MTLFYQGPGARITHEVFEAFGPPRQSFVVRELRYVHHVRSTSTDAAIGSLLVTVGTGGIAAASAILAGLGTSALDSPLTTVVAAVTLIPSTALFVQSLRVRNRPITLWAVYRGERVQLFSTRDRLVFDQVSRALLRALESTPQARI